MKPTGGTSTRIRMSCRSADHGSSLSLAWRDWPTPIDRGCNSSMPTRRIGQRRKRDFAWTAKSRHRSIRSPRGCPPIPCRLRTSMTRETLYVVQSFNAGKGSSLRADVPIPCRSAETARRTAERLAPAKAGVVAFSTAGDAELGDYDDEPTIIFKTGQLPAHFDET